MPSPRPWPPCSPGRGATALVVRGRDGLDEITTADATDVWAASGEGIRKTAFDTARFGLRRARPGDLAGGDAAYNAKVVRSVVGGEPGPALDAVPANAAGALAARSGAASTGGFEDSAASTAAMITASGVPMLKAAWYSAGAARGKADQLCCSSGSRMTRRTCCPLSRSSQVLWLACGRKRWRAR